MALRVGIVGAGRSGSRRAKQLEAYADVEITAVADPNRPTRDAFAKTFGVKLSLSDHGRLVADERVDIVYVCSPPVTRSVVAFDALDAGKHVVCEQPMAVSLGQASAMLDKAENTGRRLFVLLPHRYDPINQEARRIIENGEIGCPFLLLASYVEDEFDRLNDWHDWKGTWNTGGGGILMQRGSEMIDLFQYLIGDADAVSAVCARFAIEPLNKAEDSCLLGIEFVEDASAELALTGAARFSPWPEEYPGFAMRLEIYALEGAIGLFSSPPQLVVAAKDGSRRRVTEEEIKTDLPTDMNRDFLDAILDGKDPLVNAKYAWAALRAVLAAYKSSQMKRRVEVIEEL